MWVLAITVDKVLIGQSAPDTHIAPRSVRRSAAHCAVACRFRSSDLYGNTRLNNSSIERHRIEVAQLVR